MCDMLSRITHGCDQCVCAKGCVKCLYPETKKDVARCDVMFCHTMLGVGLCFANLRLGMLCYVMSWHGMLYCAMLCHVRSRHAMLCSVML